MPASSPPGGASPQAELDLLADGRDVLERWCASPRVRYLYPKGPNVAILLAAYQQFDRRRALGRIRPHRHRRTFRSIIKRLARYDALVRTQRLHWRYPPPRLRPPHVQPPLVKRALHRVDRDALELVRARLNGEWAPPDPGSTLGTEAIREHRGLAQFRDALINEALAHPEELASLHPQFLLFVASEPPRIRRYPLALLLLVKLPLRLMVSVALLLVLVYVGAYVFFNNARLGHFVSDRVSGLLDGEIDMQSIHWDLPLIFDLVTGSPTHVVVENISVWEPYQRYGGERKRRTAFVRRLEGGLTLHEIIPWNRLLIPTALPIPWVLHFSDLHSEHEAWFIVRQYEDTNDSGQTNTLLSLIDAFVPLHNDPEQQGLSFEVERAHLARTNLDVDFMPDDTGWRTTALLRNVDFDLRFDAPRVEDGVPIELPFRFDVQGIAERGTFALDDIEVPFHHFDFDTLACGMAGAPLGDVAFAGQGLAAGSTLALRGTLFDAFTRAVVPGQEPLPTTVDVTYGDFAHVELEANSVAPGLLATHIEHELDLNPGSIAADDAEVWATIQGPLTEPRYHLAAEGLSLDLLAEPLWIMDDVRVSVDLRNGPIPERWHGPRQHNQSRLLAEFDTFEGTVLGGTFGLDPRLPGPAHVVFAEDDQEPIRLSIPLVVDGVDPGRLSPDDPSLSQTLAGRATGRIDLEYLELGPDPAPDLPSPEAPVPENSPVRAQLRFRELRLVREHGPSHDNLPRRIRADGTVSIDPDGAIDFDGLTVRTDGTELSATGGINGDRSQLDPTQIQLRVDDGQAFARAFDLPAYFETLRADLSLFGSTHAPSGNDGNLVLAGVGGQGGTQTRARVTMEQGVLGVYAPRAQLFGGRGSVDVELTLFERGQRLDDPRLRAEIDLEGIELATLGDTGVSGLADIQVVVGDARGRAVPLSQLQLHGKTQIPQLHYAGTHYRNALAEFSLEPERVVINRLVLPVHRVISPFHDPSITIPVGQLVAEGSIGLEQDPSLDLDLRADGLPLRVLAQLFEFDLPLRGQIGAGTQIKVLGTIRRPSLEGAVRLSGLSAQGIALGSGRLNLSSEDVAEQGPLAAHRELRVEGELKTPGATKNGLQWTVDALIAFGRTVPNRPNATPAIEAEVDVLFDRVSLDTLNAGLAGTSDAQIPITGSLEQLRAHAIACDPEHSMLGGCAAQAPDAQDLQVSLQLGRAWVGGRAPSTRDPCQDPTILCALPNYKDEQGVLRDNRLQASINGTMITLDRPWRWVTGGDQPAELMLSGNLDLSSSSDPSPSRSERSDCTPPPPQELRPHQTLAGAARAEVHGELDMAVIAELLGSATMKRAKGRLEIDMALHGPASDMALSGRVTLPPADPDSRGIQLDLADMGVPVEIDELDLRIDEHWLAAAGQVRVLDEPLRFGTNGRDHTGFAFGGLCEGHWGVAIDGTVSSRIINTVAGEGTAVGGSIEIPRVVVQGTIEPELMVENAEGTMRFGRDALTLKLNEGLPEVELRNGRVDVSLCGQQHCPDDVSDGSIALHLGGIEDARSELRPSEALRAKIGPRGAASAWGTAYLSDDLSRVEQASITLQLEDVPFRDYDLRGRPVYEAELSSTAVSLEGGTPLVVSGNVAIDRARYVQDAVQGVEMLRLTEDVDLPSAPPPDFIRDLQFDLRLETRSPLRVQNNIAHGVEANAVLEITGTYDVPEFSGRIDVEPGGTVDIPFLTGTYEIQHGRVTLVRKLADAQVDVLALRQEQVYIDDQAREVYLQLGGTADAITWKCIAEGDTSGAVNTQRGCLDYLVLGAGDVQSSEFTVQRTGGGGLANARKPLQVVGHVTEFDFGRRIEDALPRFNSYVPELRLRLGQIGPELEITTPQQWLDFDYARATVGLDYTRGYPGFLLQQSRELTFKIESLDFLVLEISRDVRSYLNNRIIFDPLRQTTVEFRVDFEIPSLR